MTDLDGLEVIRERLANFIRDSLSDRHEVWKEINSLRNEDIANLRTQTHDWMQAMLNRLPPWAVWLGMLMASGLGAETMWIITHK